MNDCEIQLITSSRYPKTKSIAEIMSKSTTLEREIAKRILRTGRLGEANEAIKNTSTAFEFVQSIKRKHINEQEACRVLGRALCLIAEAYLHVYCFDPEPFDDVTGVQKIIDVIKKRADR